MVGDRSVRVKTIKMATDDEPVPLRRTPEATQTSEGTSGDPAAAAALKGDDRSPQLSDKGKQHFRELKKLLVNIERFIPEDEPETASGAGASRPAPSDGTHARAIPPQRSLQRSSAPQGTPRTGLTISRRALVTTIFSVTFLVAGLIGLVVISITRPDLFQRHNQEAPGIGAGDTALDVRMPKLIRAVAGVPSNLPIRILPAGVRHGELVLVLRGLPDEATISGATRLGPETWLIDGDEDLLLEVTTPNSTLGSQQLDVLVRSPKGTDLARARATLVVSKAAPEGVPTNTEATLTERLLESGRVFLASGEVDAARMVLQRSAELGNVEATLELARTFDPARMSTAGIKGPADELKAIYWYSEAKRLGSREAEERLRGLGR
jgi:hypothetical protein